MFIRLVCFVIYLLLWWLVIIFFMMEILYIWIGGYVMVEVREIVVVNGVIWNVVKKFEII